MLTIRPLDPITDLALVSRFFAAISDYIQMERGDAPISEAVTEYLTSAPPDRDPSQSHRLGLFSDQELTALAELAPCYPSPTDAYLGFLAVHPDWRNQGLGRHLLRHVQALALTTGHDRLYLAVLDANPKARRFWHREGFGLALANLTVTLGTKTQTAHRLVKPLNSAP